MSDSGRQIGDCKHGVAKEFCRECNPSRLSTECPKCGSPAESFTQFVRGDGTICWKTQYFKCLSNVTDGVFNQSDDCKRIENDKRPDIRHGQWQPDPIPTSGESMHDLVIEEVKKRKQIGLERYRTLLQAWNGRDALQDAIDESIDLSVYLMQLKTERSTPKSDAVVWADDATPFTGKQVADLLRENERYRAAVRILESRQWDVKFKNGHWYVPIHLGWENCHIEYDDDPITAILDAEAWYVKEKEGGK